MTDSTNTYLYVHNAVCPIQSDGKPGYATDVTPNFLVYNVQSYAAGFSFNIEENSDKSYWCFYPWAFVETDEANMQAWNEYSRLRAEVDLAKQKASEALKLVRTIQPTQKVQENKHEY